jgi:hypothetical protein
MYYQVHNEDINEERNALLSIYIKYLMRTIMREEPNVEYVYQVYNESNNK